MVTDVHYRSVPVSNFTSTVSTLKSRVQQTGDYSILRSSLSTGARVKQASATRGTSALWPKCGQQSVSKHRLCRHNKAPTLIWRIVQAKERRDPACIRRPWLSSSSNTKEKEEKEKTGEGETEESEEARQLEVEMGRQWGGYLRLILRAWHW